MKLLIASSLIIGSLFMLSACGKKEPEPPQPTPAATEVEVPMSAEPAEATGVMSAEPMEMQTEPPISADKKTEVEQDGQPPAPQANQPQN